MSEDLQLEAQAWVQRLILLTDDRRALSELRRSGSDAGRIRALPWLVSLGAAGSSHKEEVRRCLCLLFARGVQPASASLPFAGSWRRYALDQAGAYALDPCSAFSKRMMWLLDASRPQVTERLIQMALRMRGDEAIDLVGLYIDLVCWGETVQIRWGKNYWTQEAQS